jgi:hypothetical protein
MTRSRSMDEADAEAPATGPVEMGAIPAAPQQSQAEAWTSASQDVLFELAENAACDACGRIMSRPVESQGYAETGQGLYMWVRDNEVRLDPAPLCASCAAAIGVTALARWEIEEEEG